MSESNQFSFLHLYADGGVIGRNPSPVGGTFAFRILDASEQFTLIERAEVILTGEATPTVSNNLTEMLAVVAALEHVSPEADVHVFSDSLITLGRLFMGWRWTNIPPWLHSRYQAQRWRLPKFHGYAHTLLDGHPTALQLQAGVGKRGSPVSRHNVWCDKACGRAGQAYLRRLNESTVVYAQEV